MSHIRNDLSQNRVVTQQADDLGKNSPTGIEFPVLTQFSDWPVNRPVP
jgi:hypothetical protein